MSCVTKYWAQWNSLKVTDDLLERYWESAAGQSRIAQIVLPPNKLKEIWKSSMAIFV
jgi:hypothetical protein